MTLYRLNTTHMNYEMAFTLDPWYSTKQVVALLIEENMLMPVEPCEHGKIMPHLVRDKFPNTVECPGAGIGDET